MQKTEVVKKWIEDFVIKLDLCPFAQHPFSKGKIHYSEIDFENNESFLINFWDEIERIETTPPDQISNSILIIKNGLDDFLEYLDVIVLCEDLLKLQQQEDAFQIASFHPDYQFEGEGKDSPRNFTNRSPFPLIHILRVEEVSAAIEFYDGVEDIPVNNKLKMEKMGFNTLKRNLESRKTRNA